MITLLNKTYDGESIVDCHRDFSEAFDARFQPENDKIPQDEHGIAEGEYRVKVTWDSQPIRDFTQEAKDAAPMLVPKGSDKVVFILARLAYMTGAMRHHLISHPEHRAEAEFLAHIEHGAHLLGQLEGGPIEASEVKFEGMLDD